MMQMIATATMTPIGTTRRRRVWSERGRILPSAICGCAEALTLLPLGGALVHRERYGRKACDSLAVYA
jgi:hypothetical protein